MSKIRGKALLLASLLTLASRPQLAQANHKSASTQTRSRLKMVIILSRHGVRSSTWTQARLDSYAALPWPKWTVPSGSLTPRGHQLLNRFGSFDRESLATNGLLAKTGCADANSTYIWADTDQRTIESGQALGEGLFPGCPPVLHGLPEGQNDPLFHPAANGVKPAEADAAFVALSERLKQPSSPTQAVLIQQLQAVLLGCLPTSIACKAVRMPAMMLPSAAPAAVRGKGDHTVDLEGPLPLSSTFAEDFLLEYADGMPMPEVGWGHIDQKQLSRFLVLHTDYFELMHRTPEIARIEASNILFHILMTLSQATEHKPNPDAIGPVDTKLVLLSGHDTNLASLAAMLGVHWQLDGRDDDTPPGTQLAFELWQANDGSFSIRLTAAMQTLTQLRDLSPLSPAKPPAHETLTLPNCGASKTGPQQACDYDDFKRILDPKIDRGELFPLNSNIR